jgi:hypothetical protein
MAKPKGTGISSYNRIRANLVETPGYQAIRRIIIKSLDAAHIKELIPRSWERLPNGHQRHSYRIDFDRGAQYTHDIDVSFPAKATNINFDWGCIVSAEEVAREIMPYFGTKSCPTYFCKREKVLEDIVLFIRRLNISDVENVEIRAAYDAARQRIANEINTLVSDGIVERTVQEWYDNEAVIEIRKALLKYNIKPTVIKRALDEFVVHDICNS